MTTDAGSPIEPRPPFDIDLPPIVSLRASRALFEPPDLKHFESRLGRQQGVIEFIVETVGEVPVRNYGPALFVGGVEVHQSERLDHSTWRFIELQPERLELGSLITWGWMKDPPDARQQTPFRFEL
jgi:hypothetical protein